MTLCANLSVQTAKSAYQNKRTKEGMSMAKFDATQMANPGVRELQPYQAGKPMDELQRELGLDKVVYPP